MVLRLTGLGTYVRTSHDDHDDVVWRGPIDLVHDQRLVVSETRVGVDIGLTRIFGATVVLPVRVVSTSIRYLDSDGREVELVSPGIHHRNEAISGLADPMVLGSITGTIDRWRWTGRAGLTIPVGRTEEDPFVLGDMDLRHQHIQMGTGTANPVLAIEASAVWGPWRLAGFAFTQQAVYENGRGYQAGDRYAGGVTLGRRVGRWNLRAGAEVQAETAERWGGIVHTDDGNRGRFDAMIAGGASWAATERLAVDLGVKVPVVTHVVGGQLDVPAIVELGVSWRFGRSPTPPTAHDHDHDHDHADGPDGEHGHDGGGAFVHPDTTGLDVLDVGGAGAAVDLVPVAGKLTIFDFWATWCEPCKLLEPALADLAHAHPDAVAIRRIDAVDWDSAVVAQHLTPGGFGLPHLKIYDAAGQLVFESSPEPGKLDAFIEDIRKLVEPAAPIAPSAPIVPIGTPVAPLAEQPATAPTLPTPPVSPPKPSRRPVRVRITVTERGFEPASVTVPRDTPVIMTFERKTDRTCATEVVFRVAGQRSETKLPLGQPVVVRKTFTRAGTVTYACAMDMIVGTIHVR